MCGLITKPPTLNLQAGAFQPRLFVSNVQQSSVQLDLNRTDSNSSSFGPVSLVNLPADIRAGNQSNWMAGLECVDNILLVDQ